MLHRQDERRRADLLAGFGLAGLGFAIAGLGPCVALLARDLDEPADELGWLSSAFAIGLLIIAAVGQLALRTDARMAVLRSGALVCASGAVLLAFSQGLAFALAGGLLVGLGGALMLLVVPLMLAGPDAAVRIARVNAVASAISILAPLIIGAVDSTGTTGRLAMVLTVPPLVILAVLCGRATTRPAEASQQPEPPTVGPRTGGSTGVFARWVRVVLAVSVEFCFVIWAVARLVDTGLAPAAAALLGSAFPLGMAIGRAIGPVTLGRLPMLAPGAAVAAVGAVLVWSVDSPILVTAGLGLAGIGVATLYPITVADLISTPGVRPARLASLSAFASGTAILVAPAGLAAIAGWVELRTAFLITLPLLVILVAIRARPAGVPLVVASEATVATSDARYERPS